MKNKFKQILKQSLRLSSMILLAIISIAVFKLGLRIYDDEVINWPIYIERAITVLFVLYLAISFIVFVLIYIDELKKSNENKK
ncbi:hypothetical protein SG34_004010 [Thalassomonas viridans]|uniref:Uncharacterized protein n=1 Tax=Thalassomonas viridans TaxID=137584 RepID=A0AAF0CAU6_9GAMM|nr:hypothetical protein [Thalassomonas viridans]WDE06104.1 hypothetical protein SG34_004010 [Thalassomonas viridans]